MPSSFTVKRNYAHCPLKKRPLSLYNEPAIPEQEEPEDLSIKRPKTWSYIPEKKSSNSVGLAVSNIKSEDNINAPLRSPCISTTSTIPPASPVYKERTPVGYVNQYSYSPFQNLHQHFHMNAVDSTTAKIKDINNEGNCLSYPVKPTPGPNTQENFPSLAEYYLQLFKSTSEEEAKKKEQRQFTTSVWHTPSYLPPSPQNSPTESIMGSNHPATFSQKTVTVSGPCYVPPMQPYPESSALISPISTCSSTTSESEDDGGIHKPYQGSSKSSLRYSCQSCGKSYFTQSGLRKHNELHCSSLGPRAFTCKHCTKAYTTIGALKMHIRTHTLPCKCNVCGKAFSRPWLLQGHIRTHTGEKPFECNQCHRSFADRSNLRAHQQTHERVKRYACQTCKKTFSRMSLLNKHAEGSCMGVRIPEKLSVTSAITTVTSKEH